MSVEAKRLRPPLLVALFLSALLLATLFAFARKPTPSQPTAAQQFKNIQVLKKLPASQLIPVMREISASLGVRCDFCHVRGAFQKDTKPTKRIARQMIQMVQFLNAKEKILHGRATCYMCHHGNAMPITKAPMRPGA